MSHYKKILHSMAAKIQARKEGQALRGHPGLEEAGSPVPVKMILTGVERTWPGQWSEYL